MIPKVVFCPKCHRRINVPKIAGQINVASGFITLECTDKNCGGKVKIKTKDMTKEKMIEEILKITPSDELMFPGKGDVKSYNPHPLIEKYGELILGISDYWSWFTKANKNYPEKLRNGKHEFLENATENELKELLSLIKIKQEA